MKVQTFAVSDASFERSPGQEGDIFAANLVDQRHGGPITIGYGRYEPDQVLEAHLEVDDVMVVIEGCLWITSGNTTHTAGPGAIVHMPKGEAVTIRSRCEGALTAYVTYPHWQEPEKPSA